MNIDQQAAADQARLWNGHAGNVWVEAQEMIDRLLRPIETLLAQRDYPPGAQVLDVGCGTGGTTLAVARRIGDGGGCVGIDISAPMITAARERAEREGLAATFVRDDAETYEFEAAAFDAIVSRFGVMFFGDPVRAFANLRRAAKADAALDVIAWRSAAENPFMTTAERAAAPLLPEIPARRPDGPGQFSFGDRGRVEHILTESGWDGVDIQPIDIDCVMPESELEGYFTRLGPVGLALSEADAATRARIVEAVRLAFDAFVVGDEVRFTAACWRVRAGRI